MARPNYGPTVRERTKRLLDALLAYANDELENSEYLQIEVNWQTQNKLVVRTKVRFLEALTAKYQPGSKLNTEQIKEALQRLKDWLEILEDNRTKTQGCEDWHFTLKLWSKDRQENLKRLELEWESRRTKQFKSIDKTVSPNMLKHPNSATVGIDWRLLCRVMLETQNTKRLTTNPLTTGDGVAFELNEIYVPLGLVKRKQQCFLSGDVPPEQGSRVYEPQSRDELVQTFQHNEFFEQVLRPGQSKRIAIIGEPGAGKTTLLQKIAAWVLDNTSDMPIWISLADLQGKSLDQYLLQDWLKLATRRVRVTDEMQEALGELFNSRRVWLLLDAVDEMVSSSGNALAQIAQQLQGWVSDAKVVLTCRLNVWDGGKNALEAFDTYRNLDFGYGDAQIRDRVGQFIQSWFKGSPQLAERLRAELDRAGRERIKDAVKNPLRLALLCLTWALGQGGLPNTKAGLYQQFTAALYEWKHDRFPTSSTQRQELNKALGELALKAISEAKTKYRLRQRLVRSVLGELDEELFGLALQLGWLNQVGVAAESENLGEKVYAFFHPTFQDYFAAQAIENWHFFLNHIPHNPPKGTYRIFEPAWTEVILLWLGREDVPKEQKEEFIKALLEFEDGCKDFYKYRAYFLAAAGIAEFGDCSRASEIVEQIVKWAFGYFNTEKQEWWTFFKPIEEDARATLPKTERKRAIATLVRLIQSSEDEFTRWQAAASLGEIGIGDPIAISALLQLLSSTENELNRSIAAYQLGQIDLSNRTAITTLEQLIGSTENEAILSLAAYKLGQIDFGNGTAITALEQLIGSTEDESNRSLAAYRLGKIDPGNQTAILALLQLIQLTKDEYIRWQASDVLGEIGIRNQIAITILNQIILSTNNEYIRWLSSECLGKIDAGNPIAIATLLELIKLTQNEYIRRQATDSLGKVGIDNQAAISALVQLIESTKNEYTRWQAIESLRKIAPDNQTGFAALKQLIQSTQNEATGWLATESLKNTLQGEQIAVLVTGLKVHILDEIKANDPKRFHRCYNLIWSCAQNMTYPTFYQAWHSR
jgi:predicted NACHT family NTPase